jgi:hypothetical protein
MKFCDSKYSRSLWLAAIVIAISSCSFVQMAPGADEVRVVAPGQLPAGCVKRGEVEVSVKDKVAFYERNELTVKDELEVLARNEAPGLDADTVQAKGPPVDGAQRFLAFRCGAGAGPAAAAQAAPAASPPPDAAQTAPLKDE